MSSLPPVGAVGRCPAPSHEAVVALCPRDNPPHPHTFFSLCKVRRCRQERCLPPPEREAQLDPPSLLLLPGGMDSLRDDGAEGGVGAKDAPSRGEYRRGWGGGWGQAGASAGAGNSDMEVLRVLTCHPLSPLCRGKVRSERASELLRSMGGVERRATSLSP